jgi:hypothetical protein
VVVTPECPAGLILDVLENRNLLDWTDLEVALPPDPLAQYGLLFHRGNPSAGARFLSSPARRFFSTRHFKWLRDLLHASREAVVLVPRALYQDPRIALAALLVLMASGRSITILRNPAEDFLGPMGPDSLTGWISFELNGKVIATEVSCLIWTTLNPIIQGRSRNIWDLLYLLMFLGLLLKRHYQARFLR